MSKQIGQPLLRNEDMRLLTGRGQYSDDVDMAEVEAVVPAAVAA